VRPGGAGFSAVSTIDSAYKRDGIGVVDNGANFAIGIGAIWFANPYSAGVSAAYSVLNALGVTRDFMEFHVDSPIMQSPYVIPLY
jgi:hypothetical protein